MAYCVIIVLQAHRKERGRAQSQFFVYSLFHSGVCTSWGCSSPSEGPDIDYLHPASSSGNVQEQKIYIERLYIPRIGVTLSFIPTWGEPTDVQREGSGRRRGEFDLPY